MSNKAEGNKVENLSRQDGTWLVVDSDGSTYSHLSDSGIILVSEEGMEDIGNDARWTKLVGTDKFIRSHPLSEVFEVYQEYLNEVHGIG